MWLKGRQWNRRVGKGVCGKIRALGGKLSVIDDFEFDGVLVLKFDGVLLYFGKNILRPRRCVDHGGWSVPATRASYVRLVGVVVIAAFENYVGTRSKTK